MVFVSDKTETEYFFFSGILQTFFNYSDGSL